MLARADAAAHLRFETFLDDEAPTPSLRVLDYPRLGYAIEQDVPDTVRTAYDELVAAGLTSRLTA